MENRKYKIFKVKERISPFAQYYFGKDIQKMSKEVGIDEFTTFPTATKSVKAVKDYNGAYLTGLSKEEEEHFGRMLGVDLSKFSSFWKDDRSYAVLSGNMYEVTFNEGIPLDYVKMKMAIASGHLAPNKTELLENPIYKGKTNFYLYDETEEKTRIQRKNAIEDEIISILSLNRNQKDKLLMFAHSLNLTANESYSVEDVYEVIKNYIRSIDTNLEKLETALNSIKKDPIRLQATYYFTKSIGKIVNLDPVTEIYQFEGNSLATTREKSIELLVDPENKSLLNALIKSYKSKVSKGR